MLGVMSLILERELWSARGDDDFFSVAMTIPLVAFTGQWELLMNIESSANL